MKATRLVSIFEKKEKEEQTLDPNCNLKGKVIELRSSAEALLSRVYEEFHEFTDHSITHKERVLKNFDLILPESLLNNMDVYEIYFLLCSQYLHDIGMANISGLQKYAVPKNRNRFDFIRRYHHLRTKEFIVNNYKELGLTEIDARIIGTICSGHRVEDLMDSSKFSMKLSYKTDHTINVALLSLLLRIADELDLTYERTPKILLDFLDIKSSSSKIEWERHNSTIGISKDPEDKVTLVCSAKCDNPEIYRYLKKIEDKVNNELSYIPKLIGFHRQPNIMNEIPRNFRTEITAEGFYPYDFKFSVDRTAIFNLLGKQLYHYEDEPIREALKNAIDSCRYRKELTGYDYDPKIRVEYDNKKNCLIIEDNGTGMSKYHIENYLTVIGKSFYNSPEFTNSSHNFNPLSELGIGILSYFLISDKVEIDTKHKNTHGLRIVIDNNLDYFLVFDSARTEEGTRTILFLKDRPTKQPNSVEGTHYLPYDVDYFRSPFREGILKKSGELDFLKILQYYARHVEFPITYHEGSHKKVIIEQDYLSDAIKKVEAVGKELVRISYEVDKKYQSYFRSAFRSIKRTYELKKLPDLYLIYKHVKEDDVEGSIGIVLAKDSTGRIIPWSELPYMFLPLPTSSISVNGIYVPVTIFDDRFDYGEAFWYELDLHFPLKLDTSRNELLDRNQKWGLTVGILSDICKLIERQILSIGTVDDDQKYNINNDLLYLLLHSKGFTLEIPFVKKLFKKYLKYRCISKNKIEYLDANQIKKDPSIVLVYLPHFLDDTLTQKIVEETPKFIKTKKYILNPYVELGNDFISHLRPSGIRNFIPNEYYNKLFKQEKKGPVATKKFKEYNI